MVGRQPGELQLEVALGGWGGGGVEEHGDIEVYGERTCVYIYIYVCVNGIHIHIFIYTRKNFCL